MSLAASIITESLVPTALTTSRRDSGEGEGSATTFTAGYAIAGGHKPEHLQIHCPQKVLELPYYVCILWCTETVELQSRSAKELHSLLHHDSCMYQTEARVKKPSCVESLIGVQFDKWVWV